MPWRNTRDPYLIWVSEIILQQTQVVQGTDYYHRITERFPTVEALASAPVEELLLLWQGLGYYSRAHNMHHAAQQIMEEYGGKFPTTEKEVASLKGVGPYTTAAIMSFAYNVPLAVVDGNVYRVLSRLTASEIPIDTTQGQKHYKALAQQLILKAQPSAYNQAIMDLGATICTPLSPKCTACPVARICLSYGKEELIKLLPIKAKKTAITELYLDYFLLLSEQSFVVEQRDTKSIWKGLYQLPLVKQQAQHLTPTQVEAYLTEQWAWHDTLTLPTHRLTHRLLNIRVHICQAITSVPQLPPKEQLLPIAEHTTLAFPKPLRHFLDKYFGTSW